MNGSSYIHGWVRSHTWMSPATHLNESCGTRKSVLPHTWTSHITHMNGSCHTDTTQHHVYPPRRVTHMNESCHKNEWVPPHVWTSHVTHMNESCYTHVCVLPHTWVSHATQMHESHHTDTTPYWECIPATSRHTLMGHVIQEWMSLRERNESCHTGMKRAPQMNDSYHTNLKTTTYVHKHHSKVVPKNHTQTQNKSFHTIEDTHLETSDMYLFLHPCANGGVHTRDICWILMRSVCEIKPKGRVCVLVLSYSKLVWRRRLRRVAPSDVHAGRLASARPSPSDAVRATPRKGLITEMYSSLT